jgi:predicted nucleic acid-binding protein
LLERIAEGYSVRFLSFLSQLPIQVEQAWPERSMNELLARGRTNDLSGYDASYLDLAMRNGLPIATLNKKLIEAAKRMDVPILMG